MAENEKKSGKSILIKRLIIIAVIAAVAWLLGQWLVPTVVKAIFL